jgi:peptidoglycan/LPS O-acetylase OafA/YrhL
MNAGMRKLPELSLINFCRMLSVLIVLAQHVNAWKICRIPENHFIQLFYGRFICNGLYGVTMFFVLSGYLITRLIAEMPGGLYQPDFKDFYVRRIGRIVPLLLLITLVGILISRFGNPDTPQMIDCFKDWGSHYSFWFWLSIFLFVFNWLNIFGRHWGPVFALNWGVLWSLSIEEQFYLFYPLILKKIKTERRLMFFLSLVIVSGPLYRYIALLISPDHLELALHGSFGFFDQIAMGALLYLMSQKYEFFLSRHLALCRWLCGGGFAVIGWTFFSTNVGWTGFHRVYPVFGPSLISIGLFFFLLGGLHLRIFEENPFFRSFSSIGRYSYGIYLLQATVLYFLWPVIQGMDVFAAFGIFFFLTALAAYFSNRYFEVPANHWVRKKFGVQLQLDNKVVGSDVEVR